MSMGEDFNGLSSPRNMNGGGMPIGGTFGNRDGRSGAPMGNRSANMDNMNMGHILDNDHDINM